MEAAVCFCIPENPVNGLSDITAGILSYNRLEDLRRTLDAVLAIDELRVFVLDNGSTDGTPAYLKTMNSSYPNRLEILLRGDNIGIAARNDMFSFITTPFLLSLDDDSWPRSADDVLAMFTLMQNDTSIAAVCASCIHPDTGIAETAGIERFASGGSKETGYDVVNIAAGGTLLRLDAVKETEGYASDFFWGREENDLAFQLLRNGRRVVYYPLAVIWHAASPVGRDVYRRLQLVTRNSLWLLWKYFPLPVSLPMSVCFSLRRLVPVSKDIRRLRPVLAGLRDGYAAIRRMRSYGMCFSLPATLRLRHWFLKLLYE